MPVLNPFPDIPQHTDNRHDLYRESWLHCHHSILRPSALLNLSEVVVGRFRQFNPLISCRPVVSRASQKTGVMVSQFIDLESDNFHVRLPSNKIPEIGFHRQAVKTVAYLRVSTAQQDAGSQRLAILEYARKHDFRVDDFIEATASGRASQTRRRLDELMTVLQSGDRLVVSELSRLGRSDRRHPGCPR